MDSFYSQKLLKYFRNPINMGEIKNADGVATVGNPVCGDVMKMYLRIAKRKKPASGSGYSTRLIQPCSVPDPSAGKEEYIKDVKFQTLGCLPAEEEIVLGDGSWDRIVDISPKSTVLNNEREETNVVKTYKRKYTGLLLKIVPFVSPFNSFSVTPDHPILCIQRSWLKKTRRSSSKCDWLRVNEGELLSTSPNYVKAKELQKGDFLVFPINYKIVNNKLFDKKMMRLLGYYLSEGYITGGGSVINFSFNKNERKLIKEVKSLALEIMGKKGSERTRGNVTELRFCSKKWADFIYLNARKIARKKTLSLSILLLPFDKQWEMIKTYLSGNGNIYRRRFKDSQTYRITTVSKNLAIQIQEILARGGIFASIRQFLRTDCEIEGRKLKNSLQYLISFKLQRKHKFVSKHEKYFLIPIRRIEGEKFDGLVYNFQVGPGPNSYLVRGFAVHNCAAAIATSSVATEMVKGKSLEEALKLTNKQIINQLGGVPANKIHCSVLATQAIKKAIENYKKKQTKS